MNDWCTKSRRTSLTIFRFLDKYPHKVGDIVPVWIQKGALRVPEGDSPLCKINILVRVCTQALEWTCYEVN